MRMAASGRRTKSTAIVIHAKKQPKNLVNVLAPLKSQKQRSLHVFNRFKILSVTALVSMSWLTRRGHIQARWYEEEVKGV